MLWKRCGEKGRGFMECSVVSIICREIAVEGWCSYAYMDGRRSREALSPSGLSIGISMGWVAEDERRWECEREAAE